MKGEILKAEIGKAEDGRTTHLSPALSPIKAHLIRSATTLSPSDAAKGSEADMAVERYIDKHEVARRLGSATRTVDSMMRRGLIPYYKLGYRVAFRWSEIQSHLVETCRVEARAKLKAETLKAEMGLRHLTPTLSPIEAERARNTKHKQQIPRSDESRLPRKET